MGDDCVIRLALTRGPRRQEEESSFSRFDDRRRTRKRSRWLMSSSAATTPSGGETETLPLSPGLGTHFVNVYVGTPPQRQSVIIDTGSPLTAFTCVPGCDENRCGKHTDPYFDVSKSTTAKGLTCKDCRSQCLNGRCEVTQKYSEGSAWVAFQVRDEMWIGGKEPSSDLVHGQNYSVPFVFGCQTKLTGLFIPQRENGIMGMSSGDDNFVLQLKKQGKVRKAAFSLCFSEDGGTMSLGGTVQDFHASPLTYVPLVPSRNGWYLVNLAGVDLGNSKVTSKVASALLDSGTTDTYLLKGDGPVFETLFYQMTGLKYEAGDTYQFTPYELMELPTLRFLLSGSLALEMGPSKYMEAQGKGVYVPRVYFSERGMPILGANLLNGYDVLFDLEEARVGFAKARCSFNNHEARLNCNCPSSSSSALASPSITADSAALTAAAAAVAPVCGADGTTFLSSCFAQCYNTAVLWEGACPTHLPDRCHSILFSGMKGCADIARTVIKGEGSTMAVDLCLNPCWDAAVTACEGLAYEEMTHRVQVADDFCAIDHTGQYCRDIYKGQPMPCHELQETGCCFSTILALLPQAQRQELVAQGCRATTLERCQLQPDHLRIKPQPRSASDLSSPWSRGSFLGMNWVDLTIVLSLIATFIFMLLGPGWVREIPRQVCMCVTRKPRCDSGGSMAVGGKVGGGVGNSRGSPNRRRSNGGGRGLEMEEVGLVNGEGEEDDNSILPE